MNGIADEYHLPDASQPIIKVVGVGGGGSNAVNYMFCEGITDVSFVVCNTDVQALMESPIPTRLLLGRGLENEGLGAGGKPEKARIAAEASEAEIERMFKDGTKMVFITAGMGGGTGTGAAPVIAKIAKRLKILTVGIVTIPFAFERKMKIKQALAGVAKMSASVDALLVINNDKLREIYPDLDLPNAFAKADSVLAQAAKGIAKIVTEKGYINVDFEDVNTIMRGGGVAIMNTGYGEGEHRITKAIEDALNSPLLNNNDIHNSKKILLSLYCSTTNKVLMSEIDEINEFMDQMGNDIEVIWGVTYDESLGDGVKITLIATGQGLDMIPAELRDTDWEEDLIQEEVEPEPPAFKDEQEKAANDWIRELYGDKLGDIDSDSPKITLEQINADEQILRHLEEEPAYMRL